MKGMSDCFISALFTSCMHFYDCCVFVAYYCMRRCGRWRWKVACACWVNKGISAPFDNLCCDCSDMAFCKVGFSHDDCEGEVDVEAVGVDAYREILQWLRSVNQLPPNREIWVPRRFVQLLFPREYPSIVHLVSFVWWISLSLIVYTQQRTL